MLADGADVTSYALLPRVTSDGLERPHVRVRGRVSWASRFAPYAGDALLFLICFPIGLRASSLPKAVWLNVVAIGVASPLLNTAGNYAVGLARPASDVGRLLTVLPPVVVHMYFLITIAVYTGGAVTLYRRRTRP